MADYEWTTGRTLAAMVILVIIVAVIVSMATSGDDPANDPQRRQKAYELEQCIQRTIGKYRRVNVEPVTAREMAASDCQR